MLHMHTQNIVAFNYLYANIRLVNHDEIIVARSAGGAGARVDGGPWEQGHVEEWSANGSIYMSYIETYLYKIVLNW